MANLSTEVSRLRQQVSALCTVYYQRRVLTNEYLVSEPVQSGLVFYTQEQATMFRGKSIETNVASPNLLLGQVAQR